MNLCAETLQHFYNTHVFRTALDACAEEDIQSELDISYFDNAPIIELISSQVGSFEQSLNSLEVFCDKKMEKE